MTSSVRRLWGLQKLPDEHWNSAPLFSGAPVLVGPPPWEQGELIHSPTGGNEFLVRRLHALCRELSRAGTKHCIATCELEHSVQKYYTGKAASWRAPEIRRLIEQIILAFDPEFPPRRMLGTVAPWTFFSPGGDPGSNRWIIRDRNRTVVLASTSAAAQHCM